MHIAFRGNTVNAQAMGREMTFGFDARVYVPARKATGRIKARRQGAGGAWVYRVEFSNGVREEFPDSTILLARPDQEMRGHIELVVDNDSAPSTDRKSS